MKRSTSAQSAKGKITAAKAPVSKKVRLPSFRSDKMKRVGATTADEGFEVTLAKARASS